MKLLSEHSKAQSDRWEAQDHAAARRAIATDFGFYELMERQGLSRSQATACLNNEALAKRIADQRQADDAKYDISGTPSFALDGNLLVATHDWSLLQPQIDARL